jgi:hypothetical protein
MGSATEFPDYNAIPVTLDDFNEQISESNWRLTFDVAHLKSGTS